MNGAKTKGFTGHSRKKTIGQREFEAFCDEYNITSLDFRLLGDAYAIAETNAAYICWKYGKGSAQG